MNWKRYPLVRILFVFIAGILAAMILPKFSTPPYWMSIALFLFLTLLLFRNNVSQRYKYDWLFGCLLLLFFLFFGWQRTNNKKNFIDKTHFNQYTQATAYCGYVEEEAIEKARSWKSTLCIQYVRDSMGWHPVHGKILCYFAKDTSLVLPKTGENILFFSHPDTIPPALNPYVFDYRFYLQQRNIGHRVYLSSQNWKIVPGHAPFSLLRLALQVRSKLLDMLEDSPLTEAEFGVASAILLGYDDKLDPELRTAYSNAGASHILCVSGMHVGVIFIIFSAFLKFPGTSKKARIPKAIILLLLIWSYAFITGLAPSVSRSAIMLSCIVFAQTIGRRNNTWNAIIISALFLLIYNPFSLIDVGFQLSYSAVIAIVGLQKPFYNLLQVPTYFGNKIWELVSVSIVAQLGTAPLAMLYFHQFPTWFLLSNLIVIPFSSFIIYTGMAVLGFSSIAPLKMFLGKILFWEIQTLNESMEWITGLPAAVIKSINITKAEMVLVYIIIISLTIFLLQKKQKLIFVTLVAILLFCISFTTERIRHLSQNEFVIFEAGKNPAVGFVSGRHFTLVSDSSFVKNKTSQGFVTESYIVKKGLRNISIITDPQHPYYDESTSALISKDGYLFNGDRTFIIQRPIKQKDLSFSCDFLIVRNSYFGEPEDFLAPFMCNTVVIDGSNSRKMHQKWQNKSSEYPDHIYFLPVKGALVKDYRQ